MFYIGLYCESMKEKYHLISILCWILLKVLSDQLSNLFGGLYDAFPSTSCFFVTFTIKKLKSF